MKFRSRLLHKLSRNRDVFHSVVENGTRKTCPICKFLAQVDLCKFLDRVSLIVDKWRMYRRVMFSSNYWQLKGIISAPQFIDFATEDLTPKTSCCVRQLQLNEVLKLSCLYVTGTQTDWQNPRHWFAFTGCWSCWRGMLVHTVNQVLQRPPF